MLKHQHFVLISVRVTDNPTTNCGGKDEAQGEWDIYLKVLVRWQHQQNQLCIYTSNIRQPFRTR